MRIAVIGDLHGEYKLLSLMLAHLMEIDYQLLMLVGDIGIDAFPEDAPQSQCRNAAYNDNLFSIKTVLKLLAKDDDLNIPAIPVYYVAGNHDSPNIDLKGNHIFNIDLRSNGQIKTFHNTPFCGIGGSTISPGRFINEYSEDDLEDEISNFNIPENAVILTHCPPAESQLSMTNMGEMAGSVTLRQNIPNLNPRLWVCGHVHEAAGIDIVDNTPVFNAGSFLNIVNVNVDNRPEMSGLIEAMHAWIIDIKDDWNEIIIVKLAFSIGVRLNIRPVAMKFNRTESGDWTKSIIEFTNEVQDQIICKLDEKPENGNE